MSRRKPLTHSVASHVDIDMAIALGHTVQAICGKRWVSTMTGREIEGLPECPVCHPPKKVRKHKRETSRPHYVYRCYDAQDRLLYVGCTNNPPARMNGHRKNAWWWAEVAYVRNLVFPDRETALARERDAIYDEMPLRNVKNRWYLGDDRAHWVAEDYLIFREAITQSVETTHGVYGKFTTRLLQAVDAELLDRFGVTHLSGRRPA